MRITCPHCKRTGNVRDDQRGKKVRCPICGGSWVLAPATARYSRETKVDRDFGRPRAKAPNRRNATLALVSGGLVALVIAGFFGVLVFRMNRATAPVVAKTVPESAPRAAEATPSLSPAAAVGPDAALDSLIGTSATGAGRVPEERADPAPVPVGTGAAAKEILVSVAPSREAAKPSVATPAPASLKPDEIYARVSPAVVKLIVLNADLNPQCEGSGFFTDRTGVVVTNRHVIEGAVAVIVVLADGARCFAQSVTIPEADLDFAILRLPEVRGVELAVSDRLPKVGERVFAIGSPMGLTNTLSEGLVSMVHTDEDGKVVIQTSAAISHGSSGGALVDAEGRVLGMTTSGIDGAQNLGFCIPGSRMLPLLGRTSNSRDLASPFLGGSGAKENGCELSKRYLDVLAAGWEEKHAEAVSLAKALTASHSAAPMAWYVLGIAQIRPGTVEEVAAALEKSVRLAPGNAAFQLQLGYVYIKLGRNDEARAAVGRSHEAMPCDVSAFLLASLAPDDLAAVDRLQESIRLNPAFGPAFRELGCRLIALGQDARAEEALVEACRLLPEDARAHEQLGLVENRLENFAEAVNVLRKAVRLDPNQAEALFQLGYALAGSGQHAAAIEAYRECLRVMPDCAGAMLNIAHSFGALGRIDESIQALLECVRMQPEDASAHYHLGRAWLAKGDRRKAQAEVDTLRRLDPDTARQLLGEIHETK